MKPKNVKSICIALDPDNCDSTISGYVRFPQLEKCDWYEDSDKWHVNYAASISLSDCDKVINWVLTGGKGFRIDKINNAIIALVRLRRFMIDAQVEYTEKVAEQKARNKVLKSKKQEKQK